MTLYNYKVDMLSGTQRSIASINMDDETMRGHAVTYVPYSMLMLLNVDKRIIETTPTSRILVKILDLRVMLDRCDTIVEDF